MDRTPQVREGLAATVRAGEMLIFLGAGSNGLTLIEVPPREQWLEPLVLSLFLLLTVWDTQGHRENLYSSAPLETS